VAGFSLWLLAAVPRGGGESAVPFFRGRMSRGGVVWALVIGAIVLAVTYNYMWETKLSYWISMHVRSILSYFSF
jgi:hypothetical protein